MRDRVHWGPIRHRFLPHLSIVEVFLVSLDVSVWRVMQTLIYTLDASKATLILQLSAALLVELLFENLSLKMFRMALSDSKAV